MLSQESTEWVSSLGLTQQDKKEIEGKSSMLNDRHVCMQLTNYCACYFHVSKDVIVRYLSN